VVSLIKLFQIHLEAAQKVSLESSMQRHPIRPRRLWENRANYTGFMSRYIGNVGFPS
jgi:hypothetical protein